MVIEQLVLRNAIYLSGSNSEVVRQLRILLVEYGNIPLSDLIKRLQQ